MGRRKWEDLNVDCLVNVFGRVGIESLLLDVPLVCKSWCKATLNPLCWQHLSFPKDISNSRLVEENQDEACLNANKLIKFVVKRSQRCATSLALPSYCTKEELIYVAEECPALKFLGIDVEVVYSQTYMIPSLIIKWKNLEMLRLGSSLNLEEIMTQISLNCKNFVGISITGCAYRMASAIVTLLPNIKYLVLRFALLGRESLVMILKGCKQLEYLDVSYCSIGYSKEVKANILKLASHITTFKHEGLIKWDEYFKACLRYRLAVGIDGCLSDCDGFHNGCYSDD